MEWNEGDIEEAIAKSKILKSLFIVLIEDDNTSEGETWMNGQVKDVVEKNKCVLVRLKAKSTTAAQFKQLYPVFSYPTVYFINNNGKVLEVKKGHFLPLDLINSFNKALKLHNNSLFSDEQHQQTSSSPQSSMSSSTNKYELNNQTSNQLDSIERSEDARKEKMQLEIEKDRKQKNLEYQSMVALKKSKEEDEKVKREEQLKVINEKVEISKKRAAMIQFKLPDGSTLVRSFEPEDKLLLAKQFVLENLHGRVRKIKLSQLRPRVSIEDFEKTFLDYDFLPTAVLIVFYEEESNQGMGVVGLMALWARFILILQYFLSWIIPSSPNQSALSSLPPQTTNSSNKGASRPNTRRSLRQRKEGNVYRLTADDEDDEAATWNGNSTQQM